MERLRVVSGQPSGNSPVRVAYDGRDMEIMTKSQEHEDLAKFLGYLSLSWLALGLIQGAGRDHLEAAPD